MIKPRKESAGSAAGAAWAAPLRKWCDAPLYDLAGGLVNGGGVCDVRVLHGGGVVTGIAEGHRVYIRTGNRDSQPIDAECSCGGPGGGPCVHVVAVAIAAEQGPRAPAADPRAVGRPPPQSVIPARAAAPRAPARQPAPGQQQLCYLIAAPDTDAATLDAAALSLSVWITRTADPLRMQPSPCRYALRSSNGQAGHPRYVDVHDREILERLAQCPEGPWVLSGIAGYELLERVIATGRAFWETLDSGALRPGVARKISPAWVASATGDQRLSCLNHATLRTVLHLDPPVYFDAHGEWGLLDLSYPVDLLRRYAVRPGVAPEDVAEVNEQIAREPYGASFPRLRALTLQTAGGTEVRARLVLSPGPQTTRQFVYDGIAVASYSLPTADTVRRLSGDVVVEIKRNLRAERRLNAEWERFVGASPRDGAAWLQFMMTAVPALKACGWEIIIDPQFPYCIAAAGEWYADLQTNRADWFDLRLGILVDGRQVNLLPALVLYLQGAAAPSETAARNDVSCLIAGEHLLVRLEDGRHVPVPIERIQRIADSLVELYDRDSLTVEYALALPMRQAGRLTQLLLDANTPALRSGEAALRGLIDRLKGFSGIEPLSAPADFCARLRPYQQEGLGWLQFLRTAQLGGILADDMGLGKTVQTLAHLALEKSHGRLRKPSLIVAPVSVLGHWHEEIRRLAPQLSSITLHGARRKDSFSRITGTDVIIMGYPALVIDSDMLLAREFCFVILDEAQTIKNPRAKVSQVARALRAEHRLCLTGTPMENHLGELWSLFDFVQPGLLGRESEFQRHYRNPIEKSGDSARARALSGRLKPFLLRRTKDAVARDLPSKIHIVEPIVLDEAQRDFYDGIRLGQHQRLREIIQRNGLARSHISVLDALLKLRQACCDPRLVRTEARTGHIPSAKLEWLATALPELIAEGRRILLFSQFTSMLRLIEAVASQLSIPYCLLTGDTRDRTAAIDRFQAGAAPLFLISLKAGGTGLNLTAADTVIHYDPWWNPAAENQATDRAHRIGQDKPVFVYKLIAQGTVEERILQLQADKHALVSQLYGEENAAPLTVEDLDALFAP